MTGTGTIIRPQSGPQTAFLETPADIAFYGGAAGGGKTFALLMEPLRHIQNPKFSAVIFRRESTQVTNEGGLWDTASEIYPGIGGAPNENKLKFTFPKGSRVRFAHLQHEKSKHNWQGAQVPFFGFDELTHFTWTQFTYMLSRNRSTCGVVPYIRAGCNPDPDSWVRDFIDWWIGDDGFAIDERSGVIRWFIVLGNEVIWANSKGYLIKKYGKDIDGEDEAIQPKSFTFIKSNVYDNKILLKQNPEYLANLMAMPRVDRERLLGGNWDIRPVSGLFFQRAWIEIVDELPPRDELETIRYWDRAATEKTPDNDPSWTAGVKQSYHETSGITFIEHVEKFQGTPATVRNNVKNLAIQDTVNCIVGIEQDPGQAGKAEAESYLDLLPQFNVKINVVRESKANRAKPVSAQAEHGRLKLLRGPWNKAFLDKLESFDGTDKGHMDEVDAMSGGYYVLHNKSRVGVW